MKKQITFVVAILLSSSLAFYMGRSVGARDLNTYDSQSYGLLRIPILNDCIIAINPEEMDSIKSIETVRFNMPIRGVNADSFYQIHHSGSPADVLNFINSKLFECIPNSIVEYSNFEDFTHDLKLYADSGLVEKPIYAVYRNGRATLIFGSKTEDEDNDL